MTTEEKHKRAHAKNVSLLTYYFDDVPLQISLQGATKEVVPNYAL